MLYSRPVKNHTEKNILQQKIHKATTTTAGSTPADIGGSNV